MNRVAIFFAANLARSALSSDSFFSTNPSPLHSEHKPEPPQSSHVIKGTSTAPESLVLLERKVAAAPTTVAAIATEAAVSGREEAIVNVLLPPCSFTSAERGLESNKQRPWLLGLESLTILGKVTNKGVGRVSSIEKQLPVSTCLVLPNSCPGVY